MKTTQLTNDYIRVTPNLGFALYNTKEDFYYLLQSGPNIGLGGPITISQDQLLNIKEVDLFEVKDYYF